MIVALAFSMGTDLPTILGSPIGQPVATVSCLIQLLYDGGGASCLVSWT